MPVSWAGPRTEIATSLSAPAATSRPLSPPTVRHSSLPGSAPVVRFAGAADQAVVVSVQQERDALKSVGLAAAMTTALLTRGVADPTAHLASELGVLAFKRGYAEWSDGERDADHDLAQHALAALDALRAASASLR